MMYGRKQNLDTYWHVRRKYQNTKPMVSKNHSREDNLRPAGYNRSRKWEHVREITRASDGKVLYALCDGEEGDPIFLYRGSSTGYLERPHVSDTINLSPIVWEIEEQPDGSFMEIVKVRNGSGSHAHHVRYQFLEAFLPEGLKFTLYGGKQFVVANDGLANEKRYYLPKSQTIDGYHWDVIYDQVDQRMAYKSSHAEYAAYIKKNYGYVQNDDHKYLKFARTTTGIDLEGFMTNEFGSSDWELISPEFKLIHNSTKVDKARKDKLKPYIEGFWDWTLAVGNTLPIDAKGYIGECKNTLRAEKVITSGRFASTNNFDGAKVENILKDPHHELRVQLLAAFMGSPNARKSVRRSDKKAFRAAYNTWINKTCGLVTIIKGEE